MAIATDDALRGAILARLAIVEDVLVKNNLIKSDELREKIKKKYLVISKNKIIKMVTSNKVWLFIMYQNLITQFIMCSLWLV
ncbi:hypothetical protein ACIQ57_23855 [Lysinibacillus xylanilyticus]|uniref:hypothetical protein n=1 Tax=Lysinibacillus xylanilyticus TaxID=582475 RepID=UPI003815EB4B